MKKLSIWASHHKVAARFTIVLSFFLLTGLGMFIGSTLSQWQVALPYESYLVAAVLFSLVSLFYPGRSFGEQRWLPKARYALRKSSDFMLAAITFCMVVYVANQPSSLFRYVTTTQASLPERNLTDGVKKPYRSIDEFAKTMKDKNGKTLKWKERKKLLKTQIRAIKSDDGMSKGTQTALIILSVIVALGLLALLSALACNISCNGSEALAIIVGVAGAGLIIYLLVLLIKHIRKKGRPQMAT